MGSRTFKFVLVFLLIIAGVAYYGWREFNRKEASTLEKETFAIFKADSLAAFFEMNDSIASARLGGKVIQVEGIAEECSKENGTVRVKLMGSGMSAVLCQFEPGDSLAAGAIVNGAVVCIKGQCNSYQKLEMLPGGDVLLSNCIVTEKK